MSIELLRLRLGSRVFTPTMVPTLLMMGVLVILLNLGFWQLRRANEKTVLLALAKRGAESTQVLSGSTADTLPRYQHVTVTGRFEAARQILLDSMASPLPETKGQFGYRVLTPMQLNDGTLVLVDRGWVPQGASRSVLPHIGVEENLRTLTGQLDELPRPGLRAGDAGIGTAWPQVLNYPHSEELRGVYGPQLTSRIVLLDADQPDGFVRRWQHDVGFGPERHLGYALQWFGCSLTLLIIYFVVNLKKPEST